VRTLYESGKIQQIVTEMSKHKLDKRSSLESIWRNQYCMGKNTDIIGAR
jgi:hypothetical protein